MRALLVVCTLLAAGAASAREPTVVVSTGRLIVLGDRGEIREHLAAADKAVVEVNRKARRKFLEDLCSNARLRIANVRTYLGMELATDEPRHILKEGREDDERLADAVVSGPVVVADLDNLWWELGRADFNLSRAAAATDRPDLLKPIEAARAELSVARQLLGQLVGAVERPAATGAEAAPTAVPGPPAPAAAPQPMDEASFASLLGALDREAWGDERLRVLETAASTQRFTVAQAGQVLARFPFSHAKLRAASALRDRLTDRGNEFQLFASFAFESDKAALRRVLAGGEPETPKPIDNDSLDRLVQALKKGFAPQVGFQVLRDEVGRRFFVVDQVSMLISVFPTFENRLRALQILRPHVLDPENWQRLEPLFATMEDRAQLRSLFAPRP